MKKPNKPDFLRPIDVSTLSGIKKMIQGIKPLKKVVFSENQLEALNNLILELEHRDEIHDAIKCECLCYYCREYCKEVQKYYEEEK